MYIIIYKYCESSATGIGAGARYIFKYTRININMYLNICILAENLSFL